MIRGQDISHLEWLINRMIHKFGDKDNDQHIVYAKDIINKLNIIDIDISDHDLDQILTKYYIDFSMDKCEFWGFTDEERKKLRNQIRNLCVDIINYTTKNKE